MPGADKSHINWMNGNVTIGMIQPSQKEFARQQDDSEIVARLHGKCDVSPTVRGVPSVDSSSNAERDAFHQMDNTIIPSPLFDLEFVI